VVVGPGRVVVGRGTVVVVVAGTVVVVVVVGRGTVVVVDVDVVVVGGGVVVTTSTLVVVTAAWRFALDAPILPKPVTSSTMHNAAKPMSPADVTHARRLCSRVRSSTVPQSAVARPN
jgi:hypothetical protein